jgi:hypothetical protein
MSEQKQESAARLRDALITASRAEVMSPELRAKREEEARLIEAGEMPLPSMDDLLRRMDEMIAAKSKGGSIAS